METLVAFQVAAAVLVALFVYFGMDLRRKEGARNFVAPAWQYLMKVCAFVLLGAFVWIANAAAEIRMIDWMGLGVMAIGTAFVVAAKRALGTVHTFTGQYQA